MSTEPPVGRSSPEAIFRSVDLPHPDGPTTVTNSPRSTENVTRSTALVPSGNVISMSLNATPVAATTSELIHPIQVSASRQCCKLRCRVSKHVHAAETRPGTAVDRPRSVGQSASEGVDDMVEGLYCERE